MRAGEQTFAVRLKVLFAKMLPFKLWSVIYPFHACRSYLVDENDKLLVDSVGYFENLESDFREIVSGLGIDSSLGSGGEALREE